MKVKRIDLVKREAGFFTVFNGEKVKAVKHGEGFGVGVYFEQSPVDEDFGEFVWFPSDEELKRILTALYESDKETYKMLGHGWEGLRPYHKLEEFV